MQEKEGRCAMVVGFARENEGEGGGLASGLDREESRGGDLSVAAAAERMGHLSLNLGLDYI